MSNTFFQVGKIFSARLCPSDYRPGSGLSNTRAACGSRGRFVWPAMLFGNFLII